MLTDIRYAIAQLTPLSGQDRVQRALDALERIEAELSDESPRWAIVLEDALEDPFLPCPSDAPAP